MKISFLCVMLACVAFARATDQITYVSALDTTNSYPRFIITRINIAKDDPAKALAESMAGTRRCWYFMPNSTIKLKSGSHVIFLNATRDLNLRIGRLSSLTLPGSVQGTTYQDAAYDIVVPSEQSVPLQAENGSQKLNLTIAPASEFDFSTPFALFAVQAGGDQVIGTRILSLPFGPCVSYDNIAIIQKQDASGAGAAANNQVFLGQAFSYTLQLGSRIRSSLSEGNVVPIPVRVTFSAGLQGFNLSDGGTFRRHSFFAIGITIPLK